MLRHTTNVRLNTTLARVIFVKFHLPWNICLLLFSGSPCLLSPLLRFPSPLCFASVPVAVRSYGLKIAFSRFWINKTYTMYVHFLAVRWACSPNQCLVRTTLLQSWADQTLEQGFSTRFPDTVRRHILGWPQDSVKARITPITLRTRSWSRECSRHQEVCVDHKFHLSVTEDSGFFLRRSFWSPNSGSCYSVPWRSSHQVTRNSDTVVQKSTAAFWRCDSDSDTFAGDLQQICQPCPMDSNGGCRDTWKNLLEL